jgi:HEAT repeat protein
MERVVGCMGALATIALGALTALTATQELSRVELKRRLGELESELRAPRPETRRSAVRELARLRRPQSWALVLGALADEDSLVGDAAQRLLGELDDPELARELLGRAGLESREPRVALRVAEALGRVPQELDGEQIARRLDADDEECSRLLLWSIERLAGDGRLTGRKQDACAAVLALHRSRKAPELAARALLTLAELGHPDLAELAEEAARQEHPAPKSAALVLARCGRVPELDDLPARLASDGDPRVRAMAIAALAERPTRASLLALVERLEREPRLGLRLRLVDALQAATGLKHRLDARPWRHVVERLPADWQPAGASAATADPQAGASAARSPLRIPIHSDRIAFLFDFSGSMWTALPDGRTPKEIVSARLRDALQTLTGETRFNLVPYSYDPLPWRAQLCPADAARVREALGFFDGCTARGKGNVYDAARLALADPEVDRIVILTDGVPTGGTFSDLDLVVELLCEHGRLRGVAFDAVLVDAPHACVSRWARLARTTGGRVIEVGLE